MTKFSTRSGALALFLALGISLTSCNQNKREQQKNDREPTPAQTEENSTTVYQAPIISPNQEANVGRNTSGNVRLEVDGDQLLISIQAGGLELI